MDENDLPRPRWAHCTCFFQKRTESGGSQWIWGVPTFTFGRHLIVSLIFFQTTELSQRENSHLDETSDEPVARESEDSKTHSPLPVWIKSSGTPFDDK